MPHARLPLLFALLVAATPLLDCATLSPLPEGTCGNGVIDANEDCDGSSVSANCGSPTDGAKACRLTCDPAKASGCPDGWGCSTNGVCHEPTGRFEPATERSESGVVSLQVGDFDGDRRDDVLASADPGPDNGARAKVLYFGADLAVSAVTAFPAPLVSPVVRDVDRDGIADLAFGLTGLDVALGRKDRSFTPILFPSLTVPATEGLALFGVRAGTLPLPDGRLESRLAASTLGPDRGSARVLGSFDADDSATNYAALLPGSPHDIVGRGAWGRLLDQDKTSTCGEVVFAMSNPAVVVIASPCTGKPLDPTRARWASDRSLLVVPLSQVPTRGVVLADHDADGHVDILVSGTSDTLLLHNSGGLSFDKPVPAREPRKTGAKPLFDVEGVLAAGDFNGDGFPDYILPRGIQYSVATGPQGAREASYTFVPSSRSPRLGSAIVGNLNADPYLDYVAATEDSADLEFGSGVLGGVVPSTVTTPGVVTGLDAGDVDGDNMSDVIVSTTLPDGTGALAVAFGQTFGPPLAARSIGAIDTASTIHVGKSLSVVSDVFVATPKASKQGASLFDVGISVVLPSGDRQLLAPLLLPTPDAKAYPALAQWRPHNVLVGAFEDANRFDLVSLAVGVRKFDETLTPSAKRPPAPVTLWRAPGISTTTTTSFDVLAGGRELPTSAASFSRADALLVFAAAADLDVPANGVEETVVLAPAENGDATFAALRAPLATSALVTASLSGTKVGLRDQLTLVDVDGDGAKDVLAVVGDTGSMRAVVVFGDGKGGFSGAPVFVDTPAGEDVVGVTTLVTRGVGQSGPRRTELVVATGKRLLRVPIGGGARTFGRPEALADGEGGLTGVAAGDFDGDGVADLAIAEQGAVRLLRQSPRLP